jgi:hypothetical protein
MWQGALTRVVLLDGKSGRSDTSECLRRERVMIMVDRWSVCLATQGITRTSFGCWHLLLTC